MYLGYYSSGSTELYREYNSLNACQSATSYNVNCTKVISAGDPIVWRIVRINEDGSIRIVTQDNVGGSQFNTNSGDNASAGYMYGQTGQTGNNAYNLTHANDNPSTVKVFLDDWYVNNLKNYTNLMSTEAGFCNDRSIAPSAGLWANWDTALGYAKNSTVYGARGRLIDQSMNAKENAQPQFKCPNGERDLFTTSSSSKGNKELDYPIGLLTADEVTYAGAAYRKNSESIYLVNGRGYWTMSPTGHAGSFVSAFVVSRSLDAMNVYSHYGVRPVVNLKSTVELTTEVPSGCTEQNGTASCPYMIKIG